MIVGCVGCNHRLRDHGSGGCLVSTTRDGEVKLCLCLSDPEDVVSTLLLELQESATINLMRAIKAETTLRERTPPEWVDEGGKEALYGLPRQITSSKDLEQKRAKMAAVEQVLLSMHAYANVRDFAQTILEAIENAEGTQ